MKPGKDIVYSIPTILILISSTQNSLAAELEVRVGETVEITSSYRYCWYPTVHQFPTGEILVTMRMHPDELHPEGEFSAYCISLDGGRTWSRRYAMGAGANVDAAYTQQARDDGSIWVLGAGYNSLVPAPAGQTSRFHAALTQYRRGGMEVAQRRDAVIEVMQPALMEPAWMAGFAKIKDASSVDEAPNVNPWGAIIDGVDGSLLTTLYYKTRQDPRYFRLVLIRSDDDGKNWREYSTVAALAPEEAPWPWMGGEGPNESALVRLADGRLYVISRTGGGGFLGHVWSGGADGKSWTRPVSTSFKGVAPRVRRLSNGVLASTYGRPGPVTIMFSVDGTGEQWSHVTELFPGMSTRYTDLIELEPGKILVVYDSIPYGWNPIPYGPAFLGHESWAGIVHPIAEQERARNTIYGTFVQIRKK